MISNGNEIVQKIKLCSTLTIDEFPQLDFIDLHKKKDIIKEYKEKFLSIRNSYNNQMCKLPNELCKIVEEKKLVK